MGLMEPVYRSPGGLRHSVGVGIETVFIWKIYLTLDRVYTTQVLRKPDNSRHTHVVPDVPMCKDRVPGDPLYKWERSPACVVSGGSRRPSVWSTCFLVCSSRSSLSEGCPCSTRLRLRCRLVYLPWTELRPSLLRDWRLPLKAKGRTINEETPRLDIVRVTRKC